MPVRTRTRLVVLIALMALFAVGGGTTAVAAGLAAKNSVTSKSIKNNTVKSKDLKDGSVASADIADGAVGSTDIADGTVASADLQDGSVGSADVQDGGLTSTDVKDETLTGTDIAEASLGIVPNAIAVNGVQVSAISTSLTSTSGGVQVLVDGGNTLTLECTGSLRFTLHRATSGPPMLVTGIPDAGATFGESLGPNETLQVQILDGQFTVSNVRLGGGGSTAEFTGIYSVNALGANDCFYRGTITRTP